MIAAARGNRRRDPVIDISEADLEPHRRELTAYCYRMLGSSFEAEDAVQETMVRAWKALDRFEGRSSLRSWLYRIATNVCLDMLRGPQRRARPMDLGPSSAADAPLAPGLPENTWIQPLPDAKAFGPDGDPADVATSRESIRLALVAALQHLPARQRAVLILREVLRWQAREVADLLGTTVVSVNSALQRARATLASLDLEDATVDPHDDESDDDRRVMLERYVDAFERYDMTSLVALLHEDAMFSMPPHPMWLRGPDQIVRWMIGPGAECRGSRLVATAANGCPAFGSYRQAGPGLHQPWALQVLEISGGRIKGYHHFLDTSIFTTFGLPAELRS